ncbi:hypothetical protein [Arenicella xantha]|uniref:Uncharacterized protein n=1 Tax=Arenicella xantha TaxID=644221 RepID=A0A395JFC2_9GAMM|nr:hypothetical protein [Arenicella xantha]RBP48408.1 hypothetical protein DFR28_10710 [Arenicella xantha]
MTRLNGKFAGWVLDEENGVIIDAGGNEYTSDEVRALFYFRQWRAEFEGWNGRIISLKEELEKRLSRIEEPEIIINWKGQQTVVKYPISDLI